MEAKHSYSKHTLCGLLCSGAPASIRMVRPARWRQALSDGHESSQTTAHVTAAATRSGCSAFPSLYHTAPTRWLRRHGREQQHRLARELRDNPPRCVENNTDR